MKFLSTSHSITYVPGKELGIRSRPGMVLCLGLVFFALLTLGCLWSSLSSWQWGPLWAGVIPGFWAAMIGVLVWLEWSDIRLPQKGGQVTWRDGLKRGSIPGERVLGAMVDAHVQPKLHKGPGPTTFLGIWICDAELAKIPGTYPWRRLCSLNAGSYTSEQVNAEYETLRNALKELGYPDGAALEGKVGSGGVGES